MRHGKPRSSNTSESPISCNDGPSAARLWARGGGAEEKVTPWSPSPRLGLPGPPRGNPAQMRLLKCQVFEICFGGARGGGKTDGVLGEFGAHASRYGKDAIGLMVRRTRAELVETIERSREIYGPLGWQLNETEKMWRRSEERRVGKE